MLVLSRNIGSSIVIGDNIVVTVLGVNRGNQIRLGIEAPKDVSVHREEIFMKIQAEGVKDKDASPTPGVSGVEEIKSN